MYYYGNLPFRRGEPGWYTFDHRPRFNNNYVGLRDRIAILSEAYAYASFEERILSSLYFVEAIIDYAMENAGTISNVIAAAESRTGPGLMQGLRFAPSGSDSESAILMGAVEERINPYSGAPYFSRMDSTFEQMLTEYGRFTPTESGSIPAAYVVEAASAGVVGNMLRRHGIQFDVVRENVVEHLSSFRVDSTTASERSFQQVNERTIWGSWSESQAEIRKGSLRVSTQNNRARLAFYLLEPRSDDGLLNWALLDDWIAPGDLYPVHRIESEGTLNPYAGPE